MKKGKKWTRTHRVYYCVCRCKGMCSLSKQNYLNAFKELEREKEVEIVK